MINFKLMAFFSMMIKMLINFVYLSKQGVEVSLFKGAAKHLSLIKDVTGRYSIVNITIDRRTETFVTYRDAATCTLYNVINTIKT